MAAKAGATYDKEADAMAIDFPPTGAEYAESEEIAPGVVLDYDSEGRVIAVQLLGVMRLLEAGGSQAEESARHARGTPAVAE
jgi:uncharacterized protein YuzE